MVIKNAGRSDPQTCSLRKIKTIFALILSPRCLSSGIKTNLSFNVFTTDRDEQFERNKKTSFMFCLFFFGFFFFGGGGGEGGIIIH